MSSNIITTGHLAVGDGHKLYYEEWGNPEGVPIMFLHGGPGGNVKERHKLAFDPEKHRVIFFDQRGAGKSTPFASIENNTTQKLVEDIEKLRVHFGIEKMHVTGRSWGSCLALIYAITHPSRVSKLLIGGIYLGSEFENDFISTGYMHYTYPEAWKRFIDLVPEEHRISGRAITQYYSNKLYSDDKKEAQKFADEWSLWESTTLSLSYVKEEIEAEVLGDEFNLPLARLETHYFLNNCFIPDGYILDNVDKISHIPCYVVQGRFDNCTPPITAYRLAQTYGDNLTLQWVSGGHKGSDPEIMAAEHAAVNSFLV